MEPYRICTLRSGGANTTSPSGISLPDPQKCSEPHPFVNDDVCCYILLRTENCQPPSGGPTRVGERRVAAAPWPVGHPALAYFNTFPIPQHGCYNSDGPENYKQQKQMPHCEDAPPLSLILLTSRRLRTPRPHPHTTVHCNMRDGGATRPPSHIPELNPMHSKARPHGAAICNTLYEGATHVPHCIPQAHRHVHGDHPTAIICNNAASRHAAQPPSRAPRAAPHTTAQTNPSTRCP